MKCIKYKMYCTINILLAYLGICVFTLLKIPVPEEIRKQTYTKSYLLNFKRKGNKLKMLYIFIII